MPLSSTRLSFLLLSLALAGCAQPPHPPAAAAASSSQGHRTMDSTLGGYHWRLQDASDARGQRIGALLVRPELPIQFDFADGRIRVANACNGIGGDVAIDGDRVRVGALRTTRMACLDPAVMALDEEIGKRLQGEARIRLLESDPPRLLWTAANGDVLQFAGTPTPDTRSGGPGATVFLEVAARTGPCAPPAPARSCLQVREIRFDDGRRVGPPGAWQPLHGGIEGYAHEEGVRTVLRVRRFAPAGPPADAAAGRYVLEMIVESEMAGDR